MENPTILSPSSSGRRASNASNSPEFEFWMVRNPSCPETTLHSADELFSGGLLLPLHLLNIQTPDDPPDGTTSIGTTEPTTAPDPDPAPGSGFDLGTTLTASKRWKDIFRKNVGSKEKEKKKKDRNSGGGGGSSAAELNINLWPFSRSRSAGNGGGRPRAAAAAAGRKASSAPCSRSNSAGESKSRKWPSSPSRGGGVHLGRSSPVWQVKRAGPGRSLHDNLLRSSAEKGALKREAAETRRSKKSTAAGDAAAAGAKAKVLNLNVPTCIGYRHHLSCKNDEVPANIAVPVAGGTSRTAGVVTGGEGARGSNLFNIKNLFTKKVY